MKLGMLLWLSCTVTSAICAMEIVERALLEITSATYFSLYALRTFSHNHYMEMLSLGMHYIRISNI
jgi:hypothetical protein